jgi:hypothetical protein
MNPDGLRRKSFERKGGSIAVVLLLAIGVSLPLHSRQVYGFPPSKEGKPTGRFAFDDGDSREVLIPRIAYPWGTFKFPAR